MLTAVLEKFSLSDEQISAFKGLLELTNCAEKLPENPESNLVTLENLMKVIRTSWMRKEGSERWELVDSDKILSDRERFLALFDKLGFLYEKSPKFKKYDYVLFLGSLQKRVENRLDYLTSLWNKGIRFNQIILLGGERPLIKDQESLTSTLQEGATELDMMQAVFKSRRLKWPLELAEIELISVNTPKMAGKRPNTGDTINAWLAKRPHSGSVLAISNQPYVNYQNNVIRSLLPSDFTLDTTGSSANQEEKISVLLDAVAGFISADYSRVKSLLQEPNLQSVSRMQP